MGLYGIMAKVLDCCLKVREVKLHSCYYILISTNILVKCMNPLVLTAMGQIVSLLFFSNIMAEGFRFMPLGSVRLRTFRLSAWVS